MCAGLSTYPSYAPLDRLYPSTAAGPAVVSCCSTCEAGGKGPAHTLATALVKPFLREVSGSSHTSQSATYQLIVTLGEICVLLGKPSVV